MNGSINRHMFEHICRILCSKKVDPYLAQTTHFVQHKRVMHTIASAKLHTVAY